MGILSTLPRNMATASPAPFESLEAQDSSLQRARLAFLLLVVFTAILFGRPSDIILALQVIPMAQIAAIAAVLAYAAAFASGRAPLVITTEVKLVLGLTICFGLSIPFAFWRGGAFSTFEEDWLKTLIIFFLMSQTVFTLGRVKKILWVIIISMCLISIFSLTSTRMANIDDSTRYGGVSKGFFSGTYLGLAVGVILPYVAALVVRSKSVFKSFFLIFSFGLVMLMVVRTASRGSMLCVILSLLLVWALVLRDSMKARVIGIVFAAAIVVAILVAPGIFWARLSSIWDPESYATSSVAERNAQHSAEQSTNQREGLLRRSIIVTLQHPILGVGVGNFPIVSGTLTGNAQEWKGTHNSYTQVSSEAGIPALLLFVGLMFFSVRSMRRISRECAGKPEFAELALLARATQASIFSFMFACCFAHLAYDYYFYYLVGFSVALQAAYTRAKRYEAQVAPTTNGKADYGRNEGIGRLRNGNGAKGRAW